MKHIRDIVGRMTPEEREETAAVLARYGVRIPPTLHIIDGPSSYVRAEGIKVPKGFTGSVLAEYHPGYPAHMRNPDEAMPELRCKHGLDTAGVWVPTTSFGRFMAYVPARAGADLSAYRWRLTV